MSDKRARLPGCEIQPDHPGGRFGTRPRAISSAPMTFACPPGLSGRRQMTFRATIQLARRRQGARHAQAGAKALTGLLAESRVHAPQLDQARLEPLQQVDEVLPLHLVQPRAQLALVVDRDLRRPLQQAVPLFREMEPADPPVGRVDPPLHKARLFEGVDLGYHPARRYPESISQRLLRLPLGRRHEPHQRELAGMDPERLELFGEAPRRGEAQLGEQKADASGRLVRNGRVDGSHPTPTLRWKPVLAINHYAAE